MTHAQLMEFHKIASDVEDLTAEEKGWHDAFLELAESERDRKILDRAWLKHHREMVLYG